MKSLRRAGIKVGAPAVVMLAAVVNSAMASDRPLVEMTAAPADLTWVLRGGATHSAVDARVYFAAKAAKNIHSLDRIHGAEVLCSREVFDSVSLVSSQPQALAQQHTRSTHQHSAP